ncbi:tryptophan 7-halogenase [Simiduia curdlanivorans]|uniref:Tryptophan halogenase family protein n=1 Tax=Simiduia curdlanivorans TaxID=1492769 RepID=A0ABV8V0W0_9GAMM|nr:tryptophan halogenase family protein [Simiduia curdlanivorans]MDN3640413.1 tryptophan 7-halogenase [Simiduia curdlanivorans]
MNNEKLKQILIVGGGAAGWLTAAILAAEHGEAVGGSCVITLVESPDAPTLGVGEGTWPSMRDTLRRVGLSEKRLFAECDASFKQGSLFNGWATGAVDDRYYHPFTLPHGYFEQDLARYCTDQPFAYGVSAQPILCDAARAPKQLATPEYAAVVNYGYHFDAGKFGALLRDHCTRGLGVVYKQLHVTETKASARGDLASLQTRQGEELAADFFIDCSGSQSLLLAKHYQIPWRCQRDVLFNDCALATQVPYQQADESIASVTRASAHNNGWMWDIGLPTRRGLGFVFARNFISEDEAQVEFERYLSTQVADVKSLTVRTLKFDPGYRETFWVNNCVAVGMAAGFIEPLEASALAMVEQSAALIRDLLPVQRANMTGAACQYNARTLQQWQQVIEFLKLHYLVSRRDSPYWQAHRQATSLPESLADLLRRWQHRPPNQADFALAKPLFPAASYRYVLQGAGFGCDYSRSPRPDANRQRAQQLLSEVTMQSQKYLGGLPSNRDFINQWLAAS